jgi:UDP-glucuronate decarboxylase
MKGKIKKILITGGAGFLGSHLCEKLLLLGHSVTCLDNFFTGNIDNIVSLIDHPLFNLIEHDVCQSIDLDVDLIYNLACPASPIHYQFDPVKTIKTNVHGTINMLELTKLKNARLLQA